MSELTNTTILVFACYLLGLVFGFAIGYLKGAKFNRTDELEAENERLREFCIMLRESIKGGRKVTFQDIDIEFLEALGGEK